MLAKCDSTWHPFWLSLRSFSALAQAALEVECVQNAREASASYAHNQMRLLMDRNELWRPLWDS